MTTAKNWSYILPLNLADLFSSPNAQTKYVTPAIISKRKCEKWTVVAHFLQNTQNLAISRCCLKRRAKKYAKIYNELHSHVVLLISKLLSGDVLVSCRHGWLKLQRIWNKFNMNIALLTLLNETFFSPQLKELSHGLHILKSLA